MAQKIKGVIEGMNQKDKSCGLLINGNWYNVFGICSFQKGEEVEFEVFEKATPDGKIFKNVKNIAKTGITMKQYGGSIDKDKRIALLAMVKAAATVVPRGSKPEEVVAYAYELVNIVTRAIEDKEVKNG